MGGGVFTVLQLIVERNLKITQSILFYSPCIQLHCYANYSNDGMIYQ